MRFLIATLLLLAVCTAGAHIGYENNTEVRIFSDKMRVIARTSVPFAWARLGGRAPAIADEAGREIARPLLIAAAPALFEVTAGGQRIHPVAVDCAFEVENDVAFILNFERPVAWPVVLDAVFLKQFGPLDTGTISVYDYTASRFSRDLKPIAEKVISQGDSSLSFSLAAPAPAEKQAMPPSSPAVPASPPNPPRIPWLIILAGLAGIWAAWKFRRLSARP